jgi:UDP-glucose 4-epimerase
LFGAARFDAVMHFAACCYVGESMAEPAKYYDNNVGGTLTLLQAMHGAGVKRLVFSSSCAVYGIPGHLPIDESHPRRPVSPYGESKAFCETMIAGLARSHGLRSVALRYFNASGCDPQGELGERHEPETHLIPLVLREALRLKAGGNPGETRLRVNGADFSTTDGTCIRDYVHVSDLCEAHLLALRRLLQDGASGFEAFNLGSERGASVKEVIDACRRVTGMDIRYEVGARRAGDPPALVADSRRARAELGWTPRLERLDDVIATAWNWFSKQAPA